MKFEIDGLIVGFEASFGLAGVINFLCDRRKCLWYKRRTLTEKLMIEVAMKTIFKSQGCVQLNN